MAVVKPMETMDLTEQSVAFLEGRKISAATARALNVKSVRWWTHGAQAETDCLAFPYSHNGKVYAAKFRSTEVKAFASNGAPQTFFNAEGVTDWSTIIITEGEMDTLALYEAGYRNAMSIPLGAVNKVSNDREPTNDGKFGFLWRAEEKLKGATKIIIFCDSDGPGQATAEEIARRVGKDRCWQVHLPEGMKDACDVLLSGSVEALRGVVDAAKPWPVAGLYEAGHFFDRVGDIYTNGLAAGESTGYPCLDSLYTVVPGHLSVVTGYPGSGKTEFVDQIMVNLAKSKGWTFAVCSFENPPELHIAKLAAKFMGKPFFSGLHPKMSPAELAVSLDFINRHFSFVHQTDGSLSTLDSILERLKVAVLRHGVRGAVIDPYNYIQKSKDAVETDWISEMLSRVRAFAMAHGIHIWFVAHPTKAPMMADGSVPVPNGNSISGCHDEITEVLTIDGWKRHADLLPRDMVMAFDLKTGEMRWEFIEHFHVYDYDGPLHYWTGAALDLAVTPNHRMVVFPADQSTRVRELVTGDEVAIGRPRVWNDGWNFKTSNDLPQNRYYVPTSGSPTIGGCSYELPESFGVTWDEEAFWWFAGFWVAEGWVESDGISVCQAEQNSHKPREMMARLGLNVEHSCKLYNPDELPMWTGRIYSKSHPGLCKWFTDNMGEGCKNKKMPSFMIAQPENVRRAFLDGLMFGDGNKNGNVWRLATTSRQLADDIQALAASLGYWSHLQQHGRAKPHHLDRYTVSLRMERARTIQKDRHMIEEHYAGKVYCLTVESGSYVTRRNGKMAITGNSAAWWAKADMGITVHRPDRQKSNAAEIHIWKVRFNWTGREGKETLYYKDATSTYIDPSNPPSGVTPF